MCCLSGIDDFTSQLQIRGQMLTGDSHGVKEYSNIWGNVEISCYSLTMCQKVSGIVLILIGLGVGTWAFVGGAQVMSQAAAYGVGGAGIGTALVIIGIMAIVHGRFKNQVSNYLLLELTANWESAYNYPGYDGFAETSGKGGFQKSLRDVDKTPLYGRCYGEIESALSRFYIEFYRTSAIQQGRLT